MTTQGLHPHRPGVGTALSLLPYGIIWGAAAAAVSGAMRQTQCVGICAVYAGWVTYGVTLAALVLTAIVTVVQLLLAIR